MNLDADTVDMRIDAGWVVGNVGAGHVLIRNGTISVRGNTIEYVGRRQSTPARRVIAGDDYVAFPGFINTHGHVSSLAADILNADSGRDDVFNTGFLTFARRADARFAPVAPTSAAAMARQSALNFLRSGCTTVVEIGCEAPGTEHIEVVAETWGSLGLRAYVGPGYASADWVSRDGGRLDREWDETRGGEGLARAIRFAESWNGAFEDRIRPMLYPFEVARSTPALLEKTAQVAEDLDIGVSVHCAEAPVERFLVATAHGTTPVGLLARTGLLGRRTILGHAVFTDRHSALPASTDADLDLIARSGASVAHSPVPFARRGFVLESFDGYRRRGVNVSLGTDTFPQDMLFEMKIASMTAKIAERSFRAGHARDIFSAATLGGAEALNRSDLGRLAVGAKADIVVAELEPARLGPVRDPIKSLVHAGTKDDVRWVIVDGQVVLDPTAERAPASLGASIQSIATEEWNSFGELWGSGVDADTFEPLSYPEIREQSTRVLS